MTSLIRIPFADSGDKTVVPETDAGGGVNMTQGYGQTYALDPATDPSAKRIEREKMNGLFHLITAAIAEIQASGCVPFITSDDNGGASYSYGKGALTILGGVVYQSLEDANVTTPPGAKWSVLLNSDSGSSLPVGVPVPWPLSTPPTGWLKCNGATFSASQYPKLALAYPSMKLPDLRGEFLRGWDDGRGIDSGRVITSSQGDTLKSHNHTVQIAVNPSDDPYRNILGYGTGGSDKLAVKANSTTSIYGTPPLVNSSGDGETRPRNIAFNYIVRAV